MPLAALKYCVEPGCSERVRNGRCTLHARQQEQRRPNLDVRKLYKTAKWQWVRRQKQAENPLCVDCQAEGRIEKWTDLDHVVPHRGDIVLFWNLSNLEGRCHSHHSAKTARGE